MSRIDDALFAEHGWSVHEVDGSRRVLAYQGCSTLLAFGREYVSTRESKVVVTGESDVLGAVPRVWHGGEDSRGGMVAV